MSKSGEYVISEWVTEYRSIKANYPELTYRLNKIKNKYYDDFKLVSITYAGENEAGSPYFVAFYTVHIPMIDGKEVERY